MWICAKKSARYGAGRCQSAVFFQNLPQMQVRYPDNQWQEIIGNCDTQLFLGCTDELTARFISDRSGEVSVAVSSKAKQLNTWRISDYTPEYRETHSVGKRKLLSPQTRYYGFHLIRHSSFCVDRRFYRWGNTIISGTRRAKNLSPVMFQNMFRNGKSGKNTGAGFQAES